MSRGQTERGREGENPKQAPCWQWGAWHGVADMRRDPTNHEIMTWAEVKSQMLNQLSHPGAPWDKHFRMTPWLLFGKWVQKKPKQGVSGWEHSELSLVNMAVAWRGSSHGAMQKHPREVCLGRPQASHYSPLLQRQRSLFWWIFTSYSLQNEELVYIYIYIYKRVRPLMDWNWLEALCVQGSERLTHWRPWLWSQK